ncbi:TauD/TfdA family dioxygenase [Streptomyces sp. NBC_00102]|uniref:TauD/TfdA family dioxygenase n=1 Tax=Streptomyces sp. NBC_00102 TaxID=2975652 RepID=UPI00225B29E5|nr:TauD/TfdA family dioxygenase [Streptomyces sp. NBC_00102]MCX5402026.1 TauD/TfdA family dioxygenase [Streptomyces sp. NBC_00102]
MLSALFRRTPADAPPAAPATVSALPEGPPVLDAQGAPDPAAWAAGHRRTLRGLVAEHGAVTVRGLGLRTPEDVEPVFHRLTDRPVTEREAFAPRDTYAEGLHSSSAWPPNQPMCMHHELSYTTPCPGLLLFACLQEPSEGGATALADSTAVLAELPTELVARFERQGWLLTRSYNGEIGATLHQSFGTDDHDAIDAYCRDHGIDRSWQADGSLHTRQHRSAVVGHPLSGRPCWFNQIAFLNEWTLAPEVREFLVAEYGSDNLPFNTRYGNGDPVSPDVVELINEAYAAHTVRRPWRTGELTLVDNIRTAHSREAYEGPRAVVVGMGDPVSLSPARSPRLAPNPGRAAA